MTHTTHTPTQAIQQIRERAAAGQHGTMEFPCHLADPNSVSNADLIAKVEQILDMLHIDAAIDFDGTLLTVVI